MAVDFNWDPFIRASWQAREDQANRQHASGRSDAGTRGAVTGGGHLNALQGAIADLFRNAPGIDLDVRSRKGDQTRTLPGYFRPTKDWDIVVLHRGVLVAAIELKSQSGSFGNNFNNRTEEAIGNAVDLRAAFEHNGLGIIRPWLGFVMVLEAAESSTTARRIGTAAFPTDPAFGETSYLDRYRILMRRLLDEGQYDAGAIVASVKGQGITQDPKDDLSLPKFAEAVHARIEAIRQG
ncbi:MAG: PaeR7I family type II restriction endonuclease [Promicromonosporaceae bacterium]|nr:PaeR7I family type II restriction endonuclease [Promicromonosporaceae bacterium]